jgi:hypothetical protein
MGAAAGKNAMPAMNVKDNAFMISPIHTNSSFGWFAA